LGAGEYAVTVTDAAGCSTTASFNITEPVALAITLGQITPETLGSQNGAIDLSVSGGTAPLSFEWTNANGEVIANTEDVSGLAGGTYTVKVTDAHGCVITKTMVVQVVSAIHDQELERFVSLYPNPSSGMVTLQLDNGTTQEAEIQLYDMTGKLFRRYERADLTDGLFNMDMGQAAEGIYLVRLSIGNQAIAKRLVIQR
jgi:hypothetical protein